MIDPGQVNSLRSLVQAIQGLAATAEQILEDIEATVVKEKDPEGVTAKLRPRFFGDDKPTGGSE